MEILNTKIEQLEKALKIQLSDGNWNYDPYLHGMANGMIFSLAILKDEEPKYLEKPKVWGYEKVSRSPVLDPHDTNEAATRPYR